MGNLFGCIDYDFSYLNNSQQVESNSILAISTFEHPCIDVHCRSQLNFTNWCQDSKMQSCYMCFLLLFCQQSKQKCNAEMPENYLLCILYIGYFYLSPRQKMLQFSNGLLAVVCIPELRVPLVHEPLPSHSWLQQIKPINYHMEAVAT